jgi:fucose permease
VERAAGETESYQADFDHSILSKCRDSSAPLPRSGIARTAVLLQNAMMPLETQTSPVKGNAAQNLIFLLLCGGFVVNGIVITFVGPMLPVLKAKWGLDDSRAGLFSLVQFSASLTGVLLSSALVSAKGFKPAITMGLAMLGIGFALLNAPTFALALVACCIYGLGYGLATPGTNLWVGESYGERRSTALNIMNLAWGAGAIFSSPLAMFTVRTAHVSLLLYIVGGTCVLLAVALLPMPFGEPPHENESPASAGVNSKKAGIGIAVMLGILFFVYVGTENGLSYWAADHARRAATWSSNTFTLAPMFFFAGLLGGRGAAAVILLRLKEVFVGVGGILIAAAGIAVFLAARSPMVLFGGALFAGLGLASLYPIYIAWLSKWFGARARKVGGVMFALAAGGASTMPTLVGVVSRYASSLRVGLLVPLAGCAVMLVVIAMLRPNTRG